MTPGQKIREIRTQLGFSQIELSQLLSMNQSALSHCEQDKRRLSLKKCYKLISISKLKNIEVSIGYLRPDE